MFNSENAQKKWAPLLDHADCAPIQDSYRRAVTAVLLENQEKAMIEAKAHQSFAINEANETVAGNVEKFDPVLIAMIRRAMPSLIAYDVCGVQPMSGPTGLIFAMKALYKNTTKDGLSISAGDEAEAFANSPAPLTGFSGVGAEAASSLDGSAGDGYLTSEGESLTDAASSGATEIGKMGFEITKATVTARTRALKAGYTMELAQDLKAIHGLDAESELANILSTEVLAEINREIIGKIRSNAKTHSQITSGSEFDLNTSADVMGARWGQEKFQALVYRIEQAANKIGQETRRGKGNYVIVSPNVGSALAASGNLNYSDALTSTGLNIDTVGNTFAGTLNGSIKVYIDPYQTSEEVIVGYRGSNPYDAGIFYCPYVPLTMVKAVGEDDFQPRIAFKTRYGLQDNPLHSTAAGTAANNPYFRKFTVANLT